MQCRMMFPELILLITIIFVSQITSKDITFHNVVIETSYGEDEITIAEGERIKDFIPRNRSYINIKKQNIPILFEGSFGDMAMVSFLLLDNNSISEIRPGAFTGSSNLEMLSLDRNKIEEVKAGVFNNLNVRSLSLANNSISRIDSSAFDNMPSLDLIHLDRNKISTWDSNWFRNCHALTWISLDYNQIKYLPSKGFEGMLENMETQSTYDALVYLENVHSIRKVVSILSLMHNQISSIENDFLSEIFVIYFLIRGNNIECFEDSDFQVLTENFNFIGLDDNPMNCTCIDRLKIIGDRNNKRIDGIHQWIQNKCANETVS